MTILPSARQKTRQPRRAVPVRSDAERSLVHAFTTFTQAADSLEKSYGQLQTEVARLGGELERANSELTRSLEENTRVRSFLAQILEGLPCGVLVFDAARRLRVINPEARRLLLLDPGWTPVEGVAWPAVIDRLLAESFSKAPAAEREWVIEEEAGARHLGVNFWDGSRWNWADLGPPPASSVNGSLGVVTYVDGAGNQQTDVFANTSIDILARNSWSGDNPASGSSRRITSGAVANAMPISSNR